jgi:hypothetical protein
MVMSHLTDEDTAEVLLLEVIGPQNEDASTQVFIHRLL